MSGSISSYTVALSPEELARLEREREERERARVARERVLAAASRASAVTVAASTVLAPAVSTAGTRVTTARLQSSASGRDVGRGRGRETAPRVVAGPSPTSRASQPPPLDPTVRPPAPPPVDDPAALAFALELAHEARRRGFEEIAAAAAGARDEAALIAVEAALDDAIDAAETARVVEARLDEAARAVLGEDWTPQPNDVGRTRRSAAGDTLLSHVAAAADGTAVVELVVEARSTQINGRASETCGQENRLAREVLTEAATGELRAVTAPAVVRRESSHLGGLARGRSGASDARGRQLEDSQS